MFIDLQALDNIRIQFSDFERSLTDLSESNSEYFKSLNESLVEASKSVKESLDVLGIEAASNKLDAASKGLDKFSKMRDLSTKVLAGLENVNSSSVSSISSFDSISAKFEDLYKNLDKKFYKRKQKPNKYFESAKSIAGAEFKSVGKLTTSALTKLRIPNPKTGFAAGTIMAMVFGVTEEQRLAAQAGKAKNVIVASADSAMRGVVETSSQWLGAYAERMQKFYGIGEAEVFKIQNAFTQAGRKVSETILTHINPALGEVGQNAVTYSLALDKLFELASGTMADKSIEFSNKLGISISESSDALTRMLSAGSGEEGVGSLKFLEYISQATDSLESMGYRITDIVDLTYTLSERWKEIGVPKHLAVRSVGEGVQQIAQGMKGMSTEWEVVAAEYAGYGKGLSARNKFVDDMMKLSEGSKERFKDDVINIGKKILDKFDGDTDRARVFLEKGPGFGKGGARLILAMIQAQASGDVNRIKDLDAKVTEFQGQVAKSLETEQKKLTDFQLHYNEWMKGIHGLGVSILGILGDSLAVTIAFFRSLPSLMGNMLTPGGSKENEKIIKGVMKYQSFDKHIDRALSSFDTLGRAGEGFMSSSGLKDTFTNLGKAVFGESWELPKRNVPTANFTGASLSAPQSVVYLPYPEQSVPPDYDQAEWDDPNGFGTSSTYASAVSGDMSQYPTVEGASAYVNHSLAIITDGVDEQGNLNLSLKGHCPNCNLTFGGVEGGDYTEEERVMATMLESEVGSASLNTQKGRAEIAGVAFTALNRVKEKGYGKNLNEVITGGHGFGKQGGKRAYGTSVGSDDPNINKGRSVSKDMLDFARDILQGKVKNPVGNATHFLHYTGGKGYGEKAKAIPPMAQERKNIKNIITKKGRITRFYHKNGEEAPEAKSLDTKFIKSFEKKHPGIDPLTGDKQKTEVADSSAFYGANEG